jgi:hypothetical protein
VIWPLILGFILTTVLGGVLGAFLQKRTWDHQNRQRLIEDETLAAREASAVIGQLLDKRRYRMLRLLFAAKGVGAGTVAADVLARRLAEYDEVLYEWNDRLNTNLALIGSYFGEPARAWLSTQMYEGFKEIGGRLETVVRSVSAGSYDGAAAHAVETDLNKLGDLIYQISVFMTTRLRDGTVGRFAPEALPPQQLS